MKALTVRNPWAYWIIHGAGPEPRIRKPVENRTWPTKYHGPLLIHAALKMDLDAIALVPRGRDFDTHPLPSGGIIGRVNLIGCFHVTELCGPLHTKCQPWATGPWCWILSDPEPLPFAPCKGRLGLWECDWPLKVAG